MGVTRAIARGDVVTLRLPSAEVAARLQSLARMRDVTLSELLLGALKREFADAFYDRATDEQERASAAFQASRAQAAKV